MRTTSTGGSLKLTLGNDLSGVFVSYNKTYNKIGVKCSIYNTCNLTRNEQVAGSTPVVGSTLKTTTYSISTSRQKPHTYNKSYNKPKITYIDFINSKSHQYSGSAAARGERKVRLIGSIGKACFYKCVV
jgi:hypothetical protein